MTPRELAICAALKNVSFVPGTAIKRFARDMIAHAEHRPDDPLTEKQAIYLAQVAHRFRRQMPAHLATPLVEDGVERRVLPPKPPSKRRQKQERIAMLSESQTDIFVSHV